MSQPLRIPCPYCQNLVSVEMRQAGQSITCRSCKQVWEVPTLRGLQQLAQPAADESSAAAQPAARSSRGHLATPSVKRRLFAVGLAVLMIFAAAGGGMLAWARSFTTELPQAQIDAINRASFQKIDNASMDEFWTVWHDEVLARAPGAWVESGLVKNRRAARFRTNLALGLFGVAGLGLAAMIASGLMRK